jgi:hypothetical protein
MSIIFMATGLSAVGASALTVGALAIRARLAARKKAKADAELTPISGFAPEYAALSRLSQTSVIKDTTDTFRWNSLSLDDPGKSVADFSALQTRLTTPGAVTSARLHAPAAPLQEQSR